MTRKEMEKVIKEDRGSVLIGGRIITRVEDLPTEADLAKGDPEKEKQVTAAIDQQIAALLAQRAQLQTAAFPVTVEDQEGQTSQTEQSGESGQPAESATGTTGATGTTDLEKMTVEQLRAQPEAEGLSGELRKGELIAAIVAKRQAVV